MIRLLAAAALTLALATPALAKEEANAQQNRMKACNEKAEGKKGDDRKAFMSACLKGEDAAAGANSQQDRMKSCNEKAAGKKGDERKKFMSECLKG